MSLIVDQLSRDCKLRWMYLSILIKTIIIIIIIIIIICRFEELKRPQISFNFGPSRAKCNHRPRNVYYLTDILT